MERIEKSIEVHVPIHTAYSQWTHFEEFPQFMEGVEEVRQTDDQHVHWVAEIDGKRKEWDSEISLQEPDRCVAWRSVSGAMNNGRVEFSPLSTGATRVTVKMEYDTEGVVENVGDLLGVTGSRVEGDLERFRDFIESRGRETGAWRGKRSGMGAGDFARHDPAFRADFDQNYASQDGRYEDYQDAYYYGCSLHEGRNADAWSALEGDARRGWESRQPGTWERFKNAIRRGWEEIAGNA